MLSMFICAHYRQLFYDTVFTVTLGWHHRRWLMKYVTAQESQNKLLLLQQSETLHKIGLKTAIVEIHRFISSLISFIIQQHATIG